MEDVALRDLGAVLRLELRQRPIGDVLAAVAAVFSVDVEREALISIYNIEREIRNISGYESCKWSTMPYSTYTDNCVFDLTRRRWEYPRKQARSIIEQFIVQIQFTERTIYRGSDFQVSIICITSSF